MSTEVEVKLVLPDAAVIARISDDEFVTRYMKDGFIAKDMYSEYYDTPDWSLADNDYMLRIRYTDGQKVASLKKGHIDPQKHPGIYHCTNWKCLYTEDSELIPSLLARGAPEEISALVADKSLGQVFRSSYRRLIGTLYRPDMLRVELTLDSGELSAGGKSEALNELGLELLFGDSAPMLTYSEQLRDCFGLAPAMLTKQQRALRLLRTR